MITRCDVVIPYFDRPDSIGRAVLSVVAEPQVANVIIVDDHSSIPPDLHGLLIPELERKLIVVKSGYSKGAQSARLWGLGLAQQSLAVFLDSDDEILPGAIPDLLSAMDEGDYAMAYGDLCVQGRIERTMRIDGEGYSRVLRNLCLCPFSGLCVRRDRVPVTDLLRNLPAWQDDDFVLAVSRQGSLRHVGRAVAALHRSADSISKSPRNLQLGLEMLLAKWGGEIQTRFGKGRIFLWRIRLARLRIARSAWDIQQESLVASSVPRRLRLKMAYLLCLWSAQGIRLGLRPFFEKIYS